MKKLIFTIAGMLFYCGLFAQEIPQKISYQGKLLESGSPVNGTKNINFTIDTWSESHIGVVVTDGLYSVTLGETTPIPTSIFDNTSTITLQISIDGGSPLSPQTDILSVPYAYKAEKSVDAEKIAGNTVSTTVPTTNQVLKWNGTQWAPSTLSGSGTVTQVNTSTGLTGGPITTSGTISAQTTTALWNANKLQGNSLSTTSPSTGQVLKWNGTQWIPQSDSLGGLTLPYSGTNGSGTAFTITNNGSKGIVIDNYGSGRALEVQQLGSNKCGYFRIDNVSSIEDVIFAFTLGTGYVGDFNGDVRVQGTLSKGAGSFMIDHPLDPENKYLYHSFVESPDMMNVYNGNIQLNNNGEAIVELPEWFETLNKEFRYQLTCIGGYAPVYIADEISSNSFKISGGTQGMKISWQVTGIRQDPYANKNRIPLEVEKSDEEKGHYLHYKAYDQPIENSILVVKDPELLEELKGNSTK